MKKWIKGLLALSVAIGVGMTWNFVWSKNSHNKQTVTPTTSIQADADTVNRIELQPVDERGNEIMEAIEVGLGGTGVKDTDSFSKVLANVANTQDGIDYIDALKYFSLVNNNWGRNREVFGSKLRKQLRNSSTAAFADTLRSNDDERYTLNIGKLETNLKQMVKKGKLDIPFTKSYLEMNILVRRQTVEVPREHSEEKYPYYGIKGTIVDLEYSDIYSSNMTRSADKLVFDGTSPQSEVVRMIANKALRTVTFNYLKASDNSKLLDSELVHGHVADERVYEAPEIKGYVASPAEHKVNFDFQQGESKNFNFEYTETATGNSTDNENTDKKSDNNNVTAAPKPVTPFKVYGKQKLYRYSHANFTNKRRVQAHAKKVKAHAPVFTVVGTTTSSNGAARYQLSDGTHITANSKYVGKLYWNSAYKKLYVTNPKGINTYKSTALGQKVVHVKQGTPLTVKRMAKYNGMTRYQLASGQYISGSKKLVSPTKPKQVKRVKAKTTVRIYKDVNLKKVVKTFKKGSVITVKGWDYSHGNVYHVSGYKRYKVAGGYITANSKYVKIAQ
ncbi:DUF5776 domain-containing protein [Levilactobacillus lanxiensis]|uniref:DUF5776 domain-containing protein n=1 Tax=Levilactobacillus lanxiensis TaxID=2799568 RepID=A0ABW4D2W9_9LACO|nr:DUF5776 domain-containing protein [Levilactobacillus lanxiensis]